MLKMKKLSLVILMMIVMCFAIGSISSYAAEIKTITANTSGGSENTNTDSDNTNTNTNTNNTSSLLNTNTENSITSSNYSNTNTNNNASNKSALPYTGAKSSVLFVGIALLASTAYAYKKVTEYKEI